jgi:ABC-type uncharacterized transport system permease subunit
MVWLHAIYLHTGQMRTNQIIPGSVWVFILVSKTSVSCNYLSCQRPASGIPLENKNKESMVGPLQSEATRFFYCALRLALVTPQMFLRTRMDIFFQFSWNGPCTVALYCEVPEMNQYLFCRTGISPSTR